MRHVTIACAVLAAVAAAPVALADKFVLQQTSMQHTFSDRGGMMRVSDDVAATGQGIIHSVDAKNNVVNLSHGPIPSLSWPEMTMDLPVAAGVDISRLKPDDEVRFRVVLGDDQVYRITSFEVLR